MLKADYTFVLFGSETIASFPFQLVTGLCAFSAMIFEFKHVINTWLISYRPNGFSSAVVFSVSPLSLNASLTPALHFSYSFQQCGSYGNTPSIHTLDCASA